MDGSVGNVLKLSHIEKVYKYEDILACVWPCAPSKQIPGCEPLTKLYYLDRDTQAKELQRGVKRAKGKIRCQPLPQIRRNIPTSTTRRAGSAGSLPRMLCSSLRYVDPLPEHCGRRLRYFRSASKEMHWGKQPARMPASTMWSMFDVRWAGEGWRE